MNRVAALVCFGMLSVLPGFAQANQTDSQTLQAILTEVRAMHNDVRLSQTSQLLLAELGLEQTAVNRAMQRRDDFRAKLSQAQAGEKEVNEKLARIEGGPNPSATPDEKSQLADFKQEQERLLKGLKSQELELSNELQDAESSLRREQGNLESVQDQLNDVVKKLQPVSSQ